MEVDEGIIFKTVHTMTHSKVHCAVYCLESVNCVGFRVLSEEICQHTTCINPYLYNHSNGAVSIGDAYIQNVFNINKLLAKGNILV